MKKVFYIVLFFVTSFVFSQSNAISYQAVIYMPGGQNAPGVNVTNVPMASKNICLQFKFVDSSNRVEYQEEVKVKTDEFGMVNITIGQGNQTGGYASNFNSIVWSAQAQKNLQVSLDATGLCSRFEELSNEPIASVPFANAAITAGNVTGIVALVNGGTGATTAAGARTNLGIGNVENTSDLNKPMSTATKTYIDSQLTSSTIVDADATTKGKLQLAGDLAGTAAAPTVPGLALKENIANKSTDIVADAASTTKYPSVKVIKDYVDALNAAAGVADGSITSAKIADAIIVNADVAANAQIDFSKLNIQKSNILGLGIVKGDLGLGNVDNTSDAAKPVSTATQAALDLKANTVDLAAETTRATAAETTLTTNLAAEVTRATAAEATLTTNVTANATAIAAEATRATAAEATLTTNLAAEVTRATAAEATLTTNVTANATAIAAETTRATAAETTLTTNLAAEVTRATAAEATLTTNVTANATAIAAEATRATAAEATLTNNLSAEVTRATAAEALKAPLASPTFTGTVGGIDKTMVGLSNVDNTSDANKPVSTATQTALALKENSANKSSDVTLADATGVKFPTELAVKTYVDASVSSGAPDATTVIKGKIQLAGDLAGTADLPTIATGAVTSTKILDGTIANIDIADNTITGAKLNSNLYAVGKTFTFQDLLIGAGTTFGRIATDGTKHIAFEPTYNVESTRFWGNGNITIQTGGTFTDNGYKLEVDGTTKFGGNATISGTVTASSGITGTQFTSTIATGTAPFVITSTTPVANLNIGGNAATVTTNANLTGMVTSVGNATTVVTNANLTGEVTSTGNATTVTNAAVIGKVLTGYTAGAGTVAATDTILQAIQKIDGNDALKAPLASPTFTGTPTLPTGTIGVTQSAGDNTTALATTAFVTTANATNANLTGMVTSVGNTTTVVTNADLTGDVTSSGNATTIGASKVVSSMIADGTIVATDIATDAIEEAKIKNSAVTTDKIAAANITEAKLASNSVTTAKITDLNVTTAKLANDAVETAKIKAAAVTDAKLDKANIPLSGFGAATADVALGGKKLTGVGNPTDNQDVATKSYVDALNAAAGVADGSITSAKIANATIVNDDVSTTAAIAYSKLNLANSIVAADITASAVETAKINNAAVTEAKLADAAVTSAKIADATIVNADVSTTAAIAYSKLNLGNSIVAADITSDAVETAKIKDAAVTSAKILDGTIATADIANAAITYAKIQNVAAGKVLGNFTGTAGVVEEIATTGTGDVVRATSPTLVTPVIGAATGTSLSVSGQLTSTVATGTAPLVVTSTTPVANLNIGGNAATVTTNANLTGDVTSSGNATTIGASKVVTGMIADGTIIVGDLADSAVETAKIKNSAVTTDKIADVNVTTAKLATDAVETAKIKDLNVTTGKLAVSAVTTAKLADDAVETAKIKNANVTDAKLDKANIPLSGFGAATANVALGSNKLTGVADPTTAQDAANKKYVDDSISSATIADADSTTKGKLQLAGDLSGTAALPVVATGAITTAKLATDAVETVKIKDAAVTTAKITDANVTEAKLAADAVTSAKIKNGEIATVDIANAAITYAKIQNVAAGKVLGNFTGTAGVVEEIATTGTGDVVRATSPTLVTPVIGAATGTSLSVSGQLTSTVATGTAPLVVTSTTPVANLNIGGNAATVTTNANLTGDVTSSGNATTIGASKVVTGMIADGTIIVGDLADSAVETAKIKDAAVETIKIKDANVTYAKIQNVATGKVLGRVSANAGVVEEIATTGTGDVVRATSPTLVTPVLGAATGTSLSVSGQLTSTVATGTAPLVVTSTTPVANLNIGGNAATATKLATARKINTVDFDGSADITVTAAAGTLTGSTLASNVVSSSLTSVGTITTGTWNGTTIAIANGGTGSTTQNFVDLTTAQTVAGAKTFSGNTSIGGTLAVTGATTLNGNTSVSGANTLTVGTGATALGGTLAVTGATTLNGNTSVSGSNTLTVGTGATTLGGTLGVTGAATLSSTLAVTGNTTVGGNLGVTGNTTIGGTTTLNGNTSVSGSNTLTVGTGATTLGGTLGVTGNTSLSGTLAVTGATTLSSTLGVTGNIAVNTDKFTIAASSGNTVIAGTIEIDGGTPGAGKVLMSDASGLASWSNGLGSAVNTTNATYPITLANSVVFYTGTAAGAFSIPAAETANAGKEITIKNKTAFAITITPASGNIYIDNENKTAANVRLGIEASNNWVKLVSDGTQWNVLRALF